MTLLLTLLSSYRVPAGLLLAVHDRAQVWRHNDITIISGSHTAVGQETFTVRPRGPGRRLWVPARSCPTRLRPDVRARIEGGRLMIDAVVDDRVKGVRRETVVRRTRHVHEQAQRLIDAPDVSTLKGLRDRAILAIMVGGGLRQAEVARLVWGDIQMREARGHR